MTTQKIQGHDNLYKDSDSGVIHNRNTSDRDRYRIAKQQSLMNVESQHQIQSLTREVDELKMLVKQLLER